jgi:hypothetical protein
LTVVSTWWARSAEYSSASARGDRSPVAGSSRIARIFSPTGPSPGSRVRTTSRPCSSSQRRPASADLGGLTRAVAALEHDEQSMHSLILGGGAFPHRGLRRQTSAVGSRGSADTNREYLTAMLTLFALLARTFIHSGPPATRKGPTTDPGQWIVTR